MGSLESTGLTLLIVRVSKTRLVFREQKFVSTGFRHLWIEIRKPDMRPWSGTNLHTLFSSRADFCFKKLLFSDILPQVMCFHCALYDYMARTTSATTKPLIKQTECELTTRQHAVKVLPLVLHTFMDVYIPQHQHFETL